MARYACSTRCPIVMPSLTCAAWPLHVVISVHLLPTNAHAGGEPKTFPAAAHAGCWRWCVQAEDEDDAAAVVLSLLLAEVPAPAAAAGASPSVLELPVDMAGAAAPPCAPALRPGAPMHSCFVVTK